MQHSVGEVAEMLGVTVRLLHHYDEIGRVHPNGRSPSGHRRYDEGDINRLRRVLTYRALGFSLVEIGVILDDPRADTGTHLRRQRRLLTDRIRRLQQMLASVERKLEDFMPQQHPRIVPTPEQQVELLGEVAFPDEWVAEIAGSSGQSAEFDESTRRIAGYTTEDWRQIMDDERSICTRLAQVMASGAAPDSEAAMDLAEEHRSGLRRWFFDCTPEAHAAFADMFDADERMRKSFESVAAGLTDYLRRAIHADTARLEKS